MVSGVQSGSLLQETRAKQAFSGAVKYSEETSFDTENNGIDKVSSQKVFESQNTEQEKNNNVEFKSSLLDYKKDIVNDFKQFIGKIGNFNVNDEDIDYALRYGKSILVDRRA